ncbi:MAG: YcaO-related McrA-glycine thioamidation protein [Candidatus Methanomethylophilaceae archaeon]|jgi:ribosomal protein S12 methylthiotransferase accessory factor|nr:YcaO-related McrA-glycine thioamidation protein [Candidatus Methanomethylophilaceae archaeon]MDD3986322.1 YcaO-related McrA-glycine thioamidation protein [Candidatus Methanomethylophilaceae archaeon]MDD4709552.1 YcaO-related McrA-glycine thioamidation protein [Candidatus Methanomethylophilaceae archaeon]MDY0252315.1 YcaO-related McrA-glycine thioamidation protein [Candidatus Methanomethylophilaceae archaeon]NCA73425.1 YcaO-related McrA-glycine thioamidation protein [Gammaproteobacteria bacte
MKPLTLERSPKYDREGGIRTMSPEDTLERTLPLLYEAGIRMPEDITGMDNIGIPVFSISRPDAAEGAVSSYNGKGATYGQAKASAVMEAMERFSAEMRDYDELVFGTYEQAGETGLAVDPADLILPIDRLNYYRDAEIAWCEGWEMFRGEKIWVPACAVYHPYVTDGDLQLFRYNTNGLASGNTMEEAILHAAFEVIERDAWSLAEDREVAVADVSAEPDSVPGRLLEAFSEQGVEIKLKDITTDVGVPTIGAASDDVATKDPEMLAIGVGTHLDPEIAAVRAITEVAQSRATHKQGVKVNAKLQKATREMGYEKIKRLNRLWYSDLDRKVNLNDMEDGSTDYVLDDIEVVLDRLMNAGFEMAIVSDLTRPEVGVPVVRVIIPGMECSTMDPDRSGYRLNGMWPPVR